jgi:hypothetical protein
LIFQVLNKVTGGKPRGPRRSSGARRLILKALLFHKWNCHFPLTTGIKASKELVLFLKHNPSTMHAAMHMQPSHFSLHTLHCLEKCL